jgi:hypothetical protein
MQRVEDFDPMGSWGDDAARVEMDRISGAPRGRPKEVVLDVLLHDAAEQTIRESHISLSPQGVRLLPFVQRYASHAELDLMARIAGLRLKERWGGWNGEPFDSSGDNCVSAYGR